MRAVPAGADGVVAGLQWSSNFGVALVRLRKFGCRASIG